MSHHSICCATKSFIGLCLLLIQVIAQPQPIVLTRQEILDGSKLCGLPSFAQKALDSALAANGVFETHHGPLLETCTKVSDEEKKLPSIVTLAGTGSHGAVALKSAEEFSKIGYRVHVIIFPRFKSELLKAEDDSEFNEILAHIESNKICKITKLLDKTPLMIDANDRIDKARIAIKKVFDPLVDKNGANPITQENALKIVRSDLGVNAELVLLEKSLQDEAEALQIELTALLDTEIGTYKLAIESYVGAGFEHPDESKAKLAMRRQIANAIIRAMKKIKAEIGRCGGKTVSYDLPCYTTTERGYIHVGKDGTFKISRIQEYYVPHVLILISFPRESLLALDGVEPAYQLAETEEVYVALATCTKTNMSACLRSTVDRTRLYGQDKAFDDFFDAMLGREIMPPKQRFLKLQWPLKQVLTSRAYIAETYPVRNDNLEYYDPRKCAAYL